MRLQRIVRFLKIVFGRVPLRIVLPIFFAGLVTHFWKRYSDRLPRVLLNQEDSRMRSILNRCSLLSQCYSPTLWCNFPWPQMIVLVLWERLRRNSVHFVEETVRTPDLGTVELHWVRGFEPSTLPSYNSSVAQSASLPDNAPVVVFLHTLTGDSRTHCSFVAYALERGWRPVVFSRRGHSVLLSTPKFNLFGDVDDTALMVQRVRAHYPHAFIGMIGISAGSGQLVSYIGSRNREIGSPVSACCCLCPGYDARNLFDNLDAKNPFLGRMMKDFAINRFITPNRAILRTHSEPGLEKCLSSPSISHFAQSAVEFSGYESWDEYLENCNPMNHFQNCSTPILILNSLDDPLCLKDNIPSDESFGKLKDYLFVCTRFGSHIAYREGWLGQGSWMERISMEFLESCRKEYEESCSV